VGGRKTISDKRRRKGNHELYKRRWEGGEQ
jgi:hypothetical protein